jgi:HAE1 family hydrophobic/amphiphilic exporter-1
MVPLSALAKFDAPTIGPLSISHDGMFPAANLSFNLAPGVALGDAVIMLNQAKNEIGMPTAISGNFQGAAQAFQSSLASQPWLILGAGGGVHHSRRAVRKLAPADDHLHPASAGLGGDHVLWIWARTFRSWR